MFDVIQNDFIDAGYQFMFLQLKFWDFFLSHFLEGDGISCLFKIKNIFAVGKFSLILAKYEKAINGMVER